MLVPQGFAARFVADGYVLAPAAAHLTVNVTAPILLTNTRPRAEPAPAPIEAPTPATPKRRTRRRKAKG